MSEIKVGDIVQRVDVIGTGTGILYRVMNIGELAEYSVMQRTPRYNNRTRVKTCKVRLKPAIVMFESKLIAKRATVSHFLCELRKVDIVSLGVEYVKLGNLIRDIARNLSEPIEGDIASLPSASGPADGAHREP